MLSSGICFTITAPLRSWSLKEEVKAGLGMRAENNFSMEGCRTCSTKNFLMVGCRICLEQSFETEGSSSDLGSCNSKMIAAMGPCKISYSVNNC